MDGDRGWLSVQSRFARFVWYLLGKYMQRLIGHPIRNNLSKCPIASEIAFLSALGLLSIAGACAKQPYAAESLSLVSGEKPQVRVLNAAEQHEVLTAMDEVADGHHVVHSAAPVPQGVRWSDVPLAVIYACDDAEMAVVSKHESDNQCTYTIKTVDDDRGTLTVTRCDDARIYLAEAKIGFSVDRPDAARRLLDALDNQMRAFGRKREYPD
ncbi:MAG TPA: hypothetical protein VG711_04995 [Phycisphaerales bacterium]|nr:hypothetical protein [Phycisphaerales bacterium]